MRSRRKRIMLYLMIPIMFILFLIGYFEPGVQSTKTQSQLLSEVEDKEFDQIEISNLVAFAKLYGYVRYFHPSDEASQINWNSFLVYGVKHVVKADNAQELQQILEELFYPIAPTLQILPSNQQPKEVAKIEGAKLMAWQHFGLDTNPYPTSGYASKRVISDSNNEIKLFDQKLSPGTTVMKNLNSDLKAQIPIVLYSDGTGTLGDTEQSLKDFEVLNYYIKYVKHDEVTAYLVNTILSWNVFQHFYPYFDVVDVNWESELERTLANILQSKDHDGYEKNFRLMLAKLGDAQITALNESKNNFLPFNIDLIENEFVVSASESDDIQLGDRILKINNLAPDKFVNQFESVISGSQHWKKYQMLKEAFTSELAETELSLEINRNGTILENVKVQFNYFPIDEFDRTNKEPIYEIEDGTYYINQTLISDYQFNEQLEKLKNAKGIIIDLRGIQEDFEAGKVIISHLIDYPVQLPNTQVPTIIYPDQDKMKFAPTQLTVEPVSPRLTAKTVYLSYSGTISSSEIFLETVKSNKIAEIVGEDSAGATGNLNFIRLFDSQYHIFWSGTKVLKQDGSQHHLIGVKPTIPVHRTINGVLQGKDEYIEKALEIIHSQP
jgi:hypothetical protein